MTVREKTIIVILLAFVFITFLAYKTYYDFKEEKIIDGLIERAEKLEDYGNLDAARALYEYVSEMSDTRSEVIERIETLDQKIIIQREKQNYLTNLKIRNVRLTDDKGQITVSGYIRNNGHREISSIKLYLSFLSQTGQLLFNTTYISSSLRGEFLKKDEQREFSVTVPDVTGQVKRVQVMISNIDF